jgi:hypothetical protein
MSIAQCQGYGACAGKARGASCRRMTSPRVQLYLDKAELCKIKAARATLPEIRETFLELTEQWLDLAEEVRRLEHERGE